MFTFRNNGRQHSAQPRSNTFLFTAMKEQLQSIIAAAVSNALLALGKADESAPEIKIEPCKNKDHGDFASNIAMVMAKRVGMPPRDFAAKVVAELNDSEMIEKTDIAGPGFINLFIKQSSQMSVVKTVLAQGEQYGRGEAKKGKVQVEFVSANPTGPLHVGHGRGAAIGDAICRILEAEGHDVTREFYYNDAGQQIDNLARSVQLRCKGVDPESDQWPEDGYRGEYIVDLANSYMAGDVIDGVHDMAPITAQQDPDNTDAIRQFAVAYLRKEQDIDLKAFDVSFDVFSLESALYTNGAVEKAVETLIKNGHTYEKDGALWLKTTEFGDDKDRVMRKSSGGYTYFVPDVAYHLEKWQRGFDTVINEQGSDHHGTIARVRAGLQALDCGIPEQWPGYVLHQMVMVMKGGQEVKISKRAGSYVTLRDLIEQVGKDATRYFLCARRADAQLVFDIDLALQKSNENPVYYIQYAHARICSAIDASDERGISYQPDTGLENLDALDTSEEIELAKKLARYPELIQQAARERGPHLVASYLRELAALLHGWYAAGNQDKSRQLLVDDENVRNARLALASATRQVLANGLALLGVSAPTRM